MNPLLLHMLLPGLENRLIGRRITAVHWFDPVLIIDFASREAGSLIAVLSDPGPFCYRSGRGAISRTGSRRIFEEIEGSEVKSIVVPEQDRTVTISVTGDRGDWSIALLLFGAAGGAVIQRAGQVIRAVGRRPAHQPSGQAAATPQHSFMAIQEGQLAELAGAGRSLHRQVTGLESAQVDVFTDSAGVLDARRLITFRDHLLEGSDPFYLFIPARPGVAFPLPAPLSELDPAGNTLGPFSSGDQACRELGLNLLGTAYQRIVEKRLRPLKHRLKARQKLIGQLREELDSASAHHLLRRESEALAAYQTHIPAGADSAKVPDPYEPGKFFTIELDPSQPVSAQIRKRFKKATKLERSGAKIQRRLRQIGTEATSLEKVLEKAREQTDFESIQDLLDTALEKLGSPPGRPSAKKTPAAVKTYRRFDVHPDWFVLVGRNNKENDEITFKVAGPEDLWFHAQNVPGSHVILKNKKGGQTNPPRRILEVTASIAAFYSKSRHSSLVPVIFTRRKYVRKPRKAPAGQVICEREKTVFAEPVLPASPDSADQQ